MAVFRLAGPYRTPWLGGLGSLVILLGIALGNETDQEAARGSSREKAIAWLRANNAFGPRHRMVQQLVKGLEDADGGKAFFVRLGTRQVKSHKPTLLAGRNGAFQVFEVPPELAGKWVPELMTEVKVTAPLEEEVTPLPCVILDKLQFDSATALPGRQKLTGTVAFRRRAAVEGDLGLRLTFMAGEYTYTRSYRLDRDLPEDKGLLNFAFPSLQGATYQVNGVVPVFVELCVFSVPGPRVKATVLSNSVAALLNIVE
jgi:hypothetical protein